MIGIIEVRKSLLDPPREAYALDISYGGMSFNLDQPLNGNVEVIIHFTNGKGKVLKETVAGRVIWCKPIGSLYRAGIEFENLNDYDHPQLFTYIKGFTGSATHQP